MYILFKSYGLEIFNGIPELYLRKLLPSVSTLYSRKGSISSVEFNTCLSYNDNALIFPMGSSLSSSHFSTSIKRAFVSEKCNNLVIKIDINQAVC